MKQWIAVMLVTMLFLTGCPLARRPAPPPGGDEVPGPEEADIAIPEEISSGEGVEPSLRVYIAERGATVTMEFEEYLAGVVAAEMEPTWPLEALAAQAIVARTYTLQRIADQGTLPNRNAHASTNIQEFQAYNARRINDNVREAIQQTRGMVVVFEGEFVRSWFSAYCGGTTATPTEGLNFQGEDPPYLEPVDCPCYETVDDKQRTWSRSFSLSQVRNSARGIARRNPGAGGVSITQRTEAGRAVKIRVGNVTVSAPELRLALGSTQMRSTWLTGVKVAGGRVTFSGRGYGHGVGLCQWGANGLAQQGLSAEEIVGHFFRGAQVQRMWD